jgi:uncharacterized protein HemY
MTKRIVIVMVFTLSVLSSCVTSYSEYRNNFVKGKEMMARGEFQEARMYFVRASQGQQIPEVFAYAATASYKMNDMENAERYIEEAKKYDGKGFSDLRVAGYRALILLRKGETREGMEALQEYTALYSHLYPLGTIEEVETMVEKNTIDLKKLETLLDEQITWYNDEVEQFQKTRTGFYGAWD